MATKLGFEETAPATTTTGRRRCRVAISVPQLHGSVEPTMRTFERGSAHHERRVVTKPRCQGQVSRASVPRTGNSVVPVDDNCSQTLR
jgi:hypothetical protein